MFNKKLLLHLGGALFVLIIFIFILTIALKSYTRHGQQIVVPDFTNKSISEVAQICEELSISYVVADSIFIVGKKAGLVINQDPFANTFVKENRKIYLTITNSNVPELVMPRLEDLSLRQAQLIIKKLGMQIGNIETRPDIANVILEARVAGKLIKEGDKVKKGSLLDLVVGTVGDVQEIALPNLTGLSLAEAIQVLKVLGLNLGTVSGVDVLIDSTQTFIIGQVPAYETDALISVGAYIDVKVKK